MRYQEIYKNSYRQFKNTKQLSINKIILLLFCSLIISVCGCSSRPLSLTGNANSMLRTNVSEDMLQNQLNEYEELFTSRTKASAAEIDLLSDDPKIMKTTLLWRSRAIPALHNILEQQKPMTTLIDTWLLCTRLTNYIDTGEAGNILGEYKPIALQTAEELQAGIENIGRNMLTEQVFEETSTNLRNLALANPIQSGFSKTLMYSNQVKADQKGLIESVVSIPLSPVRALEGVDRTPKAIYDFSSTTQHLTDVVQELPESARWQLLLLLYDLEETEMAQSFLTSLDNISTSSENLAETAAHLSTLLEDNEKIQGQIRETLEKADNTAAEVQKVFTDAQETATTFSQTVQDVNSAIPTWTSAASQTALDVNMAITSWRQAAVATENLVKLVKPESTSTETEPAQKIDVRETAEAVRDAANEIKLISEGLPDRTGEFVAHTERLTAQINLLSTRITINIAILITLVFGLSVVFYFIKNKSARLKK